jgi:hypothetical protein
MDKKTIIVAVVALAVGVALSSQIKQLPLVNKLPL